MGLRKPRANGQIIGKRKISPDDLRLRQRNWWTRKRVKRRFRMKLLGKRYKLERVLDTGTSFRDDKRFGPRQYASYLMGTRHFKDERFVLIYKAAPNALRMLLPLTPRNLARMRRMATEEAWEYTIYRVHRSAVPDLPKR